MDKGKTLIAQASLPNNLWGFAIMTATCLINRLPSKALGLQSPIAFMEKCFPTIRLRNGLPPKVFAYVCYIHVHNMATHKFSAKAVKGVFVGYSTTQKGYRCSDSLSRKIFITGDVIFDENTFYYKTVEAGDLGIESHSIQTPCPLPSVEPAAIPADLNPPDQTSDGINKIPN